MANDLQTRPGYRVLTIPKGPQKGYKVLRVSWPEQRELRMLKRLADQAQTDADSEELGGATLEMYKILATFIPEWTLVDRTGRDLPQPKDDPTAFDKLDSFTLTYFVPAGDDCLWSDVLPNAR